MRAPVSDPRGAAVNARRASSKISELQADQQTHPAAWCDPTMCGVDDRLVGDRYHVFHSPEIPLPSLDRLSDGNGNDFTQSVVVAIRQGVEQASPTMMLWSDSAGSLVGYAGFELRMTRAEFMALYLEMGRAITATT
jgi:hypothetical protein